MKFFIKEISVILTLFAIILGSCSKESDLVILENNKSKETNVNKNLEPNPNYFIVDTLNINIETEDDLKNILDNLTIDQFLAVNHSNGEVFNLVIESNDGNLPGDPDSGEMSINCTYTNTYSRNLCIKHATNVFIYNVYNNICSVFGDTGSAIIVFEHPCIY